MHGHSCASGSFSGDRPPHTRRSSRGPPGVPSSEASAAGLDSHFYSAFKEECDDVKRKFPTSWVFESSDVFQAVAPDRSTGSCPDGTIAVYRLFNNRTDANHRYTTDAGVRAQMISRGYVPEGYGPQGVALCALA